MRGIGKLLLAFLILTSMLLLYVHERVEALRISYRIYEHSSALSQRGEELRRLQFEVAQLRSPQNLERKLEESSFGLTLPKEIQVLRVPKMTVPNEASRPSLVSPRNRFLDFLGQWIQIAQARTEQ